MQNNIELARPVDEDLHTIEELVQEAETYGVDGEADGHRELENIDEDDSDEAEESGSDADSEGDASEEEEAENIRTRTLE